MSCNRKAESTRSRRLRLTMRGSPWGQTRSSDDVRRTTALTSMTSSRRDRVRVARSGPDAGLVKGEGFAVDASVMEADASRYHGKAPGEIDWSAAGNVLGASAITAARLA
jgi:hypothetical protein